jgi:hypothetical protein
MSSLLRPAVMFALVSLLAAVSMPGCSQQGEGERCDLLKNGDADCDSGLVCIAAAQLRDSSSDRCCPPDGSSNEARCDPKTAGGNTGGSGNSVGGEGGAPLSEAGTSSTDGGMSSTDGGNGGTSGSGATGGAPETAGAPAQTDGGAPAASSGAGAGGA